MDPMRALYLHLSKRVHPDKGPVAEQDVRTRLMQDVNAAYAQRDLSMLQRIAASLNLSPPTGGTLSAADMALISSSAYRKFFNIMSVLIEDAFGWKLTQQEGVELYRVYYEPRPERAMRPEDV